MLIMSDVLHVAGPRVVLDHASLAVASGEIVLLAGPAGSGKTSVLRVIAGTLMPRHGNISWNHILLDARFRQRHLAYGTALAPIIRNYDLSSYLGLFARGLGMAEELIEPDVDRVLEQMGMRHLRWRALCELADSEMVRSMIASCLMGTPQVVLLDQSLSLLDAEDCAATWAALQETARQGAAILLTAYPDQLQQLQGGRRLHIEHGRIR